MSQLVGIPHYHAAPEQPSPAPENRASTSSLLFQRGFSPRDSAQICTGLAGCSGEQEPTLKGQPPAAARSLIHQCRLRT